MPHYHFPMTPTTPRYPEDKGFLTVPTDDVAQPSSQLIRVASDSTGDILNRDNAPSTPRIHFTIHTSTRRVIA
jgi:hypothetical protein